MSIYKYTFRFNASHSNTDDRANLHTHSFVVSIYMKYSQHLAYNIIEKDIKQYLSRYKGKCMNDFCEKTATIENIADVLFRDLDIIIGDNNLITLELSESPVALLRIRRS